MNFIQKTLSLQADDLNMFKEPFKWFVFNTTNADISINLKIYCDSKFYVANYNVETKQYIITAIYKISEESLQFYRNNIFLWSIKQSFIFYRNNSITQERLNLENSTINISIVIWHNDSLQHLGDYR